MKRRIIDWLSAGSDPSGRMLGFNLRVRGDPTGGVAPQEHDLELQFAATWLDTFIARFLQFGLEEATARGLPGEPPDGEERALVLPSTTHAGAGLGEGGGAIVTLRFGIAQVNAHLTAAQAIELARQLVELRLGESVPSHLQ